MYTYLIALTGWAAVDEPRWMGRGGWAGENQRVPFYPAASLLLCNLPWAGEQFWKPQRHRQGGWVHGHPAQWPANQPVQQHAGQTTRYPVLLNPDNANAANSTVHALSEGATWNSPSSAFLIIIVVITILWTTDTISINQSINEWIYLSIHSFIYSSIIHIPIPCWFNHYHHSINWSFHLLVQWINGSIDQSTNNSHPSTPLFKYPSLSSLIYS